MGKANKWSPCGGSGVQPLFSLGELKLLFLLIFYLWDRAFKCLTTDTRTHSNMKKKKEFTKI